MVMHCASCKVEYRDGFSVCADCGAALREGEPPAEGAHDESLQPVFETAEPSVVAVVKSLLHDAGIEYVVRGESVQGIFSGVSLSRSGAMRFYVAPEDAVDVREVLAEVTEDAAPHQEVTPWPAGDPDETFQEIMNLEISGWDALSSSSGEAVEFYSSVLHDDCAMIFPGGRLIEGRDSILESITASWEDYEIEDAKSVWLGPGALTMIYRVRASRDGSDYEALVSSTYVLTDDDWKLSMHQHTPV